MPQAARSKPAKVASARRSAGAAQRAPATISRPELLVDGSDKEFRHLVHNLFALGSRHEAVRAGHGVLIGLTGIEYTFLVAVAHLQDDGDVSVKLLADHLHVSGAFATTMVGKLIGRGLLTKESDEVDRRRVRLYVTAAGLELLAKLAPTQRKVNDVQFGSISAQEFRFLQDIVARLIESSDQAIALQSYLAMESAAQPAKAAARKTRK